MGRAMFQALPVCLLHAQTGTVVTLMLELRKQEHREVNSLAQGYA